MEVLQQSSLDTKRLLLKKTRYPKVRNFVLFYVWEDARVSLKHSFDMHLRYLGTVSPVFTF